MKNPKDWLSLRRQSTALLLVNLFLCRSVALALVLAAALAATNRAQAQLFFDSGSNTIPSGTVVQVSSGNALGVTGSGTSVTAPGPLTLINSGTGFGAAADFGADMKLNDTTVETQGSFYFGILVGGGDINGAATATLTNVDITTSGTVGASIFRATSGRRRCRALRPALSTRCTQGRKV